MGNQDCPVEIIRGTQIISGIDSAKNDVIVLLPAEASLLPGAIFRMLSALQENDSAVGGCFGATYDGSGLSPRLKEILHRIWFVASGICAGDQVMFFRRGAFQGSFPVAKQMTVIELSLRMKETGATVFVPGAVFVAARKPKPSGNWIEFMKALFISLRYLTLRRLGWLPRDTSEGYPTAPTDPAKKQAA